MPTVRCRKRAPVGTAINLTQTIHAFLSVVSCAKMDCAVHQKLVHVWKVTCYTKMILTCVFHFAATAKMDTVLNMKLVLVFMDMVMLKITVHVHLFVKTCLLYTSRCV